MIHKLCMLFSAIIKVPARSFYMAPALFKIYKLRLALLKSPKSTMLYKLITLFFFFEKKNVSGRKQINFYAGNKMLNKKRK